MRTSILFSHFTALSLVALSGCLSHTRTDADAGTDAPLVPRDGCACVDGPRNVCEAMRVSGVGLCDVELGYAWDGSTCRSLSACSCDGADCAQLAPTETACLEAHRACSRVCGSSFGGPLPACLGGEFCNQPGCGADDSLGVCTVQPSACIEPAGMTVCACDGVTYPSECEANAAGASVSRPGPCDASSTFGNAQMSASCGPADGPAWSFTLTTAPTACGAAPADGSLQFEIWTDLNSAPSEQTYRLSDFASDGQARICGAAGAPCATATGSVTIHFFATGEVTRFDYNLTTPDGRSFAASNVEGTNWCRVAGPGCG